MLRAIYAECRYAECHYAECHYAEYRYAECHYAECRYPECYYAECRGAISSNDSKEFFCKKNSSDCQFLKNIESKI
jgi:hypothetical protein